MTYSVIGLLAVAIHLIINKDILWHQYDSNLAAESQYRRFLNAIIIFHITDAMWGILHDNHLAKLLYVDTMIYFISMAVSVLLWTRFVIRYLNEDERFNMIAGYSGWVLFVLQIGAMVINLFYPIVFTVDATGEYHAGVARYVCFSAQMLMFFITSGITFYVTARSEGARKRHHLMIALFGLAMILAIAAQIFFPLLPLYSIGYLLGGCVLHTFVVEDERADYMHALEESLGREAIQKQQLDAAKLLVDTDPLTGVKSKRAYKDAEEKLDKRIAEGTVSEFATAVFDLNCLKLTNDTKGHEAGDQLLIDAANLICTTFKHCPVFRIGGDEFVALIEGSDFRNRYNLMKSFDKQVESNLNNGKVIVSGGLSEFSPKVDTAYTTVFQRADERMYRRKQLLKEMGAKMRE